MSEAAKGRMKSLLRR